MNQYYSEELSQKTKRGLRETRIKGNYMGGPINYGYSVKHENVGDQVVAKVVVNEAEAPVLLHIFEAYAAGNRIPDIVRELDDKGIKNRGKPFTVNSIYFMLQQEKYTGVYTFNGETFTHIYPAIIPKELFQIVRKRIDKNKTGKHVIGVDYILMGKCYCGYCGHKLRSAAGTTTDGTILRYYRCPYSKKDVNCCNKSVRKEVLEEIVTNVLAEELTKPDNLKILTDKVFELYCKSVDDADDLHHYEKELAATDRAIKNILSAIEEGIFTPSTKQRLTELEEKKVRIEQAIIIENAKEKSLLTKEDIERYICDAVKLTAKQMIEFLVERIEVYTDKICIKLKYTDTPIEPPTDFSDYDFPNDPTPLDIPADSTEKFSNKTSLGKQTQTDSDTLKDSQQNAPQHDTFNGIRPDRNCSCRGVLIFSFTKQHTLSRPRTYRSGRTRVFTRTATFIVEIYI